MSAQSTSLAAAELQERVKAVVEQTGSRLTSTRVLTPAEEGSFYRVAVNVRMRVTVEALQEVLHGLEGALPYMTVDNVTVLARRARRNRRNKAAGPQTLDVRFDLSALMPRGTA